MEKKLICGEKIATTGYDFTKQSDFCLSVSALFARQNFTAEQAERVDRRGNRR